VGQWCMYFSSVGCNNFKPLFFVTKTGALL
jgi:hypothetical protein